MLQQAVVPAGKKELMVGITNEWSTAAPRAHSAIEGAIAVTYLNERLGPM
jgi:hypothetical protein